jgi:hypothetical protein
MHINADIASAAICYVDWTGDDDFDRDSALPMLVETARLWAALGYHGEDGTFHLDGVTGPDEYSALADDKRLHQPRRAAQPGRRGRCGGAMAARVGEAGRDPP